ncbi:MAG TPA: cupredoxin domain-containing protein [Acidimicrobiales bacterium]|jgi:plastocyanin|nr:cupredoxin domain-containing protein [Acidimicrobiales bacterium]
MMRRVGVVAVLVLSTMAVVAACGSSGSSSKSPSGTCTAVTGGKVTVDAKDLQFTQRCLTVAAGQPFTVTFDNKDSGTPHDWVLKGAGSKVGTEIITGGHEATAKVPALKAGDYTYVCTVHPNMSGTLKVGRSATTGSSIPG